jgi:(4-(4-[2-(gamma-L-glutamylamino)ethyl]phenoxymethyl)furan-2-yl)methanamine synthase
MKWLALDIGGANLKAADGEGFAVSEVFPLWQRPNQLAESLRTLIALVPKVDHIAATMTGELADCYATKTEGVQAILTALEDAADRRHTRVYLTSGMLVAVPIARRQPLLAAASNWHALAKFAGRYAPHGPGMVIDIGSTTTDIIPLSEGMPTTIGRTDTNRLLNGELVYSGVERTPLCAILSATPFRGRKCPLAAEVFATTSDVYVTLGNLPEEPSNSNTADGRPATKEAALARLARSICADCETFNEVDALAMAEAACERQVARIMIALRHVLERMPQAPSTIVLSGRGEFLARKAIEEVGLAPNIISLSRELGTELSRCAGAHALAVLAREGLK